MLNFKACGQQLEQKLQILWNFKKIVISFLTAGGSIMEGCIAFAWHQSNLLKFFPQYPFSFFHSVFLTNCSRPFLLICSSWCFLDESAWTLRTVTYICRCLRECSLQAPSWVMGWPLQVPNSEPAQFNAGTSCMCMFPNSVQAEVQESLLWVVLMESFPGLMVLCCGFWQSTWKCLIGTSKSTAGHRQVWFANIRPWFGLPYWGMTFKLSSFTLWWEL